MLAFIVGIFLPSLSVGAAGGRLFAMLIQAIVTGMGSEIKISLPAYAVQSHGFIAVSRTASGFQAHPNSF